MSGVQNLITTLIFSLIMPIAAFANVVTCSDEATLRSTTSERSAFITFSNNSHHMVNIYWLNYAGKRAIHLAVSPGSVESENSYVTHPWVVTDEANNCIGIIFPSLSTPTVNITDSGISFSHDPDESQEKVSGRDPKESDVINVTQMWRTITIFVFGVIFIVSILSLAFIFPEPTAFQYTVCRIILALAASGVATLLPGTLDVKIPGYLTASAAFAVFVIVYFRTPAELVINRARQDNPESANSRAGSLRGGAPGSGSAVASKLDPSYGPHSGWTKVSITGNGFTGASDVNFGASPGTNFKFENDGLVTVNSPSAQSKDNEVKVSIVFPGTSPPKREVGTFCYYTIDPSHGPTTGGGQVRISGSGLKEVSAVRFGENNGTNLTPLQKDAQYMNGREFRTVTAPPGNSGSDVPVQLVFPVESANKISVVGTFHYDAPQFHYDAPQ
jgi:hypothetical protein